jgi:hypothetical protein
VQRIVVAHLYTVAERRSSVSGIFTVEDVRILGSKSELIALPGGRLKNAALRVMPDAAARFFTNSCRLGTFLVSIMKKPGGIKN